MAGSGVIIAITAVGSGVLVGAGVESTILQAVNTAASTGRKISGFDIPVLLALVKRDGAVASRVELMRDVWGHRAAVVSRTVDTHIAELRKKLEDDPASPVHILTVHKAGYRFAG